MRVEQFVLDAQAMSYVRLLELFGCSSWVCLVEGCRRIGHLYCSLSLRLC